MANLLIIDDQAHRRESLFRELEHDGYHVTAVSSPEVPRNWKECLKFDMAIINLFPDAMATWELQQEFKTRLPDFPVLVYMIKNLHAVCSLKSAVSEILKKNRSRQKPNIQWNKPMIAVSLDGAACRRGVLLRAGESAVS